MSLLKFANHGRNDYLAYRNSRINMARKELVLALAIILLSACGSYRAERQVTKPLDSFPLWIQRPMKPAAVITYWSLINAGIPNDSAVLLTHRKVGRLLVNTPYEYWERDQFMMDSDDYLDWWRRNYHSIKH